MKITLAALGIACTLAASCALLATSAHALSSSTSTSSTTTSISPTRRAVELTFLKSNAGERENLKQFIRLNWFAMDLIAEKQGLMSSYHLFETGSDDGEWNVLVQVVYPNEKGYDGIKEEFEKIRAAHKTILVNGKSLRDLGAIVRSQKTFEDLPAARK